jgi:hypothetical protein
MGDDAQSHRKTIIIKFSSDPIVFIKMVIAQYELPVVVGIGHTWDCLLNDKMMASIKENSVEVKSKVTRVSFSENNMFFFKYNPDKH